jgi:hypothetical protein
MSVDNVEEITLEQWQESYAGYMMLASVLSTGVLIEKLMVVKLVNKSHAFYEMDCRGLGRIVI